MRLAPWSLCSVDGIPFLQITSSTNTFARVSLSVVFKANASVHLLKRSVKTRTYLFPCVVSGNGPSMSHDNMSNGYLASTVPRGACAAGVDVFRC